MTSQRGEPIAAQRRGGHAHSTNTSSRAVELDTAAGNISLHGGRLARRRAIAIYHGPVDVLKSAGRYGMGIVG